MSVAINTSAVRTISLICQQQYTPSSSLHLSCVPLVECEPCLVNLTPGNFTRVVDRQHCMMLMESRMAVERGSGDLSARFRSVATHTHSRHAKLKVASFLVSNIHLIKLTTDNNKLHTAFISGFYKRSNLGHPTVMSLHVLPYAYKPQWWRHSSPALTATNSAFTECKPIYLSRMILRISHD
jgi:hypothetical protein